MEYLDFEIEISSGEGNDYAVSVLHSAAGEARGNMHFPFEEQVLELRLLTLQNALLRSGGFLRQLRPSDNRGAQDFGRDLFDALFTGEIYSRFKISQAEAAHQNKGLRIKLRIQSSRLSALPWEFLYDQNQAEYLCLSNNNCFFAPTLVGFCHGGVLVHS